MKKLNSDEEDADFIPKENTSHKQKEKVTFKKTMRKEYGNPDIVRVLETTRGAKSLVAAETSKLAKKPGQKRFLKSSATTRAEAKAEVARAARAPQLRTREDHTTFPISTIQGMEKNIMNILLNQKSLKRIMQTKFHDLDIKVTQLTTTVNHLKREVDAVHTPSSGSGADDDMSLPTTTQFMI
ncbi:hypothetical protein D1007_18262 [Hordeum vulgare]|nr:hypothetical protein D1007_18262 [Hordeum vulgare]